MKRVSYSTRVLWEKKNTVHVPMPGLILETLLIEPKFRKEWSLRKEILETKGQVREKCNMDAQRCSVTKGGGGISSI